MAQDLNKVMLVCRLAADPELRSLQSGTSVCSLRVAFNTSKKDPQTGEWQDVGNFMNVTVWGAQGERIAQHLTKGQRIGIDGRLEHRTWEQDGNRREAHQIVADRVQYLDPKQDRPANSAPPAQSAPAGPAPADDDIPF